MGALGNREKAKNQEESVRDDLIDRLILIPVICGCGGQFTIGTAAHNKQTVNGWDLVYGVWVWVDGRD